MQHKKGFLALAIVLIIGLVIGFESISPQCITEMHKYTNKKASGDMYAQDYPINFMGNSHGRCLVGGYCVGTYLANL